MLKYRRRETLLFKQGNFFCVCIWSHYAIFPWPNSLSYLFCSGVRLQRKPCWASLSFWPDSSMEVFGTKRMRIPQHPPPSPPFSPIAMALIYARRNLILQTLACIILAFVYHIGPAIAQASTNVTCTSGNEHVRARVSCNEEKC